MKNKIEEIVGVVITTMFVLLIIWAILVSVFKFALGDWKGLSPYGARSDFYMSDSYYEDY